MEAQRKGFGPSQVLLRSFSGPSRTAPAWVLSRVCSSYWQKINLLQNESFTDSCARGPEALPSPPSSLTLVSAGLFFTCSFALFSLILVSYRAAQYFNFLLFLFLGLLFWVRWGDGFNWPDLAAPGTEQCLVHSGAFTVRQPLHIAPPPSPTLLVFPLPWPLLKPWHGHPDRKGHTNAISDPRNKWPWTPDILHLYPYLCYRI